jgi:hypothetical protein
LSTDFEHFSRLSTALCRGLGRHRLGSRVVRSDDIHSPVERG